MYEVLNSLADQVSPEHTALLVIDAQNDYLHPNGNAAKKRGVSVDLESVKSLNTTIDAARSVGVTVFYIRVVHSADSMVPTKRIFRPNPDDIWPVDGTWGAELYEELTPSMPGDINLIKHNYDSFDNTSLELHLRALDIKTVVVTGYSTEVCVDSTTRTAFHKGYYPVVPRECTGGFREENREAAFDIIGRFFGKVVSVEDLLEVWDVPIGTSLAEG